METYLIKHNDLTCDTEQKEIANLDLDAVDRIHRFLRLQKKTGYGSMKCWMRLFHKETLEQEILTRPVLIRSSAVERNF
jgi:hypothetical protein